MNEAVAYAIAQNRFLEISAIGVTCFAIGWGMGILLVWTTDHVRGRHEAAD